VSPHARLLAVLGVAVLLIWDRDALRPFVLYLNPRALR
jgi:hypothetical protein